jgi:hypothetical protein
VVRVLLSLKLSPDFKSLKLSSICIRVLYILTIFFASLVDSARNDVASNHGSCSRLALESEFELRRARSPVAVSFFRPLSYCYRHHHSQRCRRVTGD